MFTVKDIRDKKAFLDDVYFEADSVYRQPNNWDDNGAEIQSIERKRKNVIIGKTAEWYLIENQSRFKLSNAKYEDLIEIDKNGKEIIWEVKAREKLGFHRLEIKKWFIAIAKQRSQNINRTKYLILFLINRENMYPEYEYCEIYDVITEQLIRKGKM